MKIIPAASTISMGYSLINCDSFVCSSSSFEKVSSSASLISSTYLSIVLSNFSNIVNNEGDGGVVNLNGDNRVCFDSLRFVNCKAKNGGGVYGEGVVDIGFSNCVFSGCQATSGKGGGIYLKIGKECSVVISPTTFMHG